MLDKTFTSLTFYVGPVPVVLLPELEIVLSGKGEVSGGVDTSVDASVTARAGAKYEDGALSPIADFEKTFADDPPEPEAAATLSSEIEVKAYGVGGPAFGLDTGLELGADISQAP